MTGPTVEGESMTRAAIVAAELAQYDRWLRRRTLRPGQRIAIGGARGMTARRAAGELHSYCDNAYMIAGRPACALSGCHRPASDPIHEVAP